MESTVYSDISRICDDISTCSNPMATLNNVFRNVTALRSITSNMRLYDSDMQHNIVVIRNIYACIENFRDVIYMLKRIRSGTSKSKISERNTIYVKINHELLLLLQWSNVVVTYIQDDVRIRNQLWRVTYKTIDTIKDIITKIDYLKYDEHSSVENWIWTTATTNNNTTTTTTTTTTGSNSISQLLFNNRTNISTTNTNTGGGGGGANNFDNSQIYSLYGLLSGEYLNPVVEEQEDTVTKNIQNFSDNLNNTVTTGTTMVNQRGYGRIPSVFLSGKFPNQKTPPSIGTTTTTTTRMIENNNNIGWPVLESLKNQANIYFSSINNDNRNNNSFPTTEPSLITEPPLVVANEKEIFTTIWIKDAYTSMGYIEKNSTKEKNIYVLILINSLDNNKVLFVDSHTTVHASVLVSYARKLNRRYGYEKLEDVCPFEKHSVYCGGSSKSEFSLNFSDSNMLQWIVVREELITWMANYFSSALTSLKNKNRNRDGNNYGGSSRKFLRKLKNQKELLISNLGRITTINFAKKIRNDKPLSPTAITTTTKKKRKRSSSISEEEEDTYSQRRVSSEIINLVDNSDENNYFSSDDATTAVTTAATTATTATTITATATTSTTTTVNRGKEFDLGIDFIDLCD